MVWEIAEVLIFERSGVLQGSCLPELESRSKTRVGKTSVSSLTYMMLAFLGSFKWERLGAKAGF